MSLRRVPQATTVRRQDPGPRIWRRVASNYLPGSLFPLPGMLTVRPEHDCQRALVLPSTLRRRAGRPAAGVADGMARQTARRGPPMHGGPSGIGQSAGRGLANPSRRPQRWQSLGQSFHQNDPIDKLSTGAQCHGLSGCARRVRTVGVRCLRQRAERPQPWPAIFQQVTGAACRRISYTQGEGRGICR